MELITFLPFWYQSTIVFLLGLIIGSFLNVVIYRYHTGKSLNGHSHCMSCGYQLRWYELFPVVSYVLLKGRCRSCGCSISARYFLVEIATAFLFLGAFFQFAMSGLFVFSVVLIAALIIIAVYDIYHMVIPNDLVIWVCFLALLHYYMMYGFVWEQKIFISSVVAAFGSFLFYGGLWFVSKGRWIGFGDAKLSIPFGFILGPLGTFTSIVFSFWIGAIVSILLLFGPAVYKRFIRFCSKSQLDNLKSSITMKSEVPFAPFMITAFLMVYLYQVDIFSFLELFI